MFKAIRPAVETVLQSCNVQQSTHFTRFVQDELSKIDPDIQRSIPGKGLLNDLYELRSRYLDWELGTGYLGFFSKNPGTRYTFTRRMEVVYQMLPQLSSDLYILEIGCGAGLLCHDLAQVAKMVAGIDISYFVLDFAHKVKEYLKCGNLSFHLGDAETLMFQDQVFDIVISSEVLEHLISPEKSLSEIRRVIKDDGTVILSTPCAVSLSDITMNIFRIFNKHIESEKDVHFDKKTYLAVQRGGEHVSDKTFMRVHKRFRYHTLVTMFQNAGFQVEQAVGTVLAFPPHYQIFYRYCPTIMLPAIRRIEGLLNKANLFQHFGSVTTCFRLKPDVKRET